jgi:uncharacterized membrane protein
MHLDYISLFSNFPKELAIFLIAMVPIGELRASIPIAIEVYNMSWYWAYFWSVLGNTVIVTIILFFLEPVSKFLMARFNIFNKLFNWLFERTRKKYKGKFEKWGALALITFVAIPLPVTGGWSGALAAFVFGIPFKQAVPLIFAGLLSAGVIVVLITTGVSLSLK